MTEGKDQFVQCHAFKSNPLLFRSSVLLKAPPYAVSTKLSFSLLLFATIGHSYFAIIAGLILGGVIASPTAAGLTKKLPIKTMMIFVGVVVIAASIRIIIVSFL